MDNKGEILIYQTEDGLTKIEVNMEDETVWLNQTQLMELYQCSKSNISEHITNIFNEGELKKEEVVRKFRTTGSDGKMYSIIHYNLDMIISLLTSGNRKLLEGPGKISHDQAMKKAKTEYRKYQELTLSPVEEEYLKSIKGVEKEVKKRKRI